MVDTQVWRAGVRARQEANCPASMRTPITSKEIVWSGPQIGAVLGTFHADDQALQPPGAVAHSPAGA